MEFDSSFNKSLARIHAGSESDIGPPLERYRRLAEAFESAFDTGPQGFLSVPGRIEIGGNHTDHAGGRVIAAAVHLDTIAAVTRTDDGIIVILSEGFPEPSRVEIGDTAPRDSERGTTAALVRGIAARFKELGLEVGGFRARVESRVAVGSGLSSSAAFEVLLGSIIDSLYNGGVLSPIQLALVGQHAENHYFGKPCGLMDQIACASGGVVAIDFRDDGLPRVEELVLDLDTHGYRAVLVHTGSSHADLADDYASIPLQMRQVAHALGRQRLGDANIAELMLGLPTLRARLGDQAILRAIHFFDENRRVDDQVDAIRRGDLPRLLSSMRQSGQSSQKWLQNSFSPSTPGEQGISLALCLSERFIEEIGEGAWRVHGGGFAGTILALLPDHLTDEYRARMHRVFGPSSTTVVHLRQEGVMWLG